ncbi:MAG: hypothetical protein AB8F74_15750 [Saprospiraceae bacterium]
MLNQILKGFCLVAIFSLSIFTSCNKEATTELDNGTTTEAFTSSVMNAIQRDASTGPQGCFEFVFPITVAFEDESTATVNDYDELKDAVQAWRESNPDAKKRPNLVFPVEVISEDGELISVSDREELKTLKEACGKGHGKCRKPCFKFTFPLTVTLPDGTTVTGADRSELKSLIRAWKEDNPDATERPALVFPIEVTLQPDGETVTVNDSDELKALKESCKENDE